MLPILRSRSSRVLVAMFCALALLRMPLVAFAEEATSFSSVIIDAPAAPTITAADTLEVSVFTSTIGSPLEFPFANRAPNALLIEYSILRL